MVKYGLIGCGRMGHEHIRNINLLQDTQVAAIFEPDAAMRASAAKLAPAAVFPESVDALLAIDALDCLVIASPNFMHIDQLKQVTARRTLPILVEKPLATDPADHAFIQDLQQSYAAPIWVAMEYRFMPPMARFLERVKQVTGGIMMLSIREHRYPFLGKVGDWNRFNRFSGGTLVEKCCHFFDLMRLIVQSEPTRVMASGSMVHNHLDERYDGEQPDIWDSAYTIVDFANGARAMLDLCMFAEGSLFQEEIAAVGPNGKIECLVPGPARLWPSNLGPQPEAKIVISPRDPIGPTTEEVPVDQAILDAGDHHGSTFYQHQQFREVVLGNATPAVTLNDGWQAVAIGMAAQRAAETGMAITP